MSHREEHAPRLEDTRIDMGSLGGRLTLGAGAVGLVALAAAVALGFARGDGLRHFGFSYLVSYAFFLSVSLGALIFVPLQYITRASWSVVIRRLAEVAAAALPVMALLLLPILLNLGAIYSWVGGDAHHPTELLEYKRPFLNPTFFLVRWIVYFLVWTWLAFTFWQRSRRQDATADVRETRRLTNLSGPALVLLAVTVALSGMDLLMTLDYAWFSTIFGVYYFAGGFVSFCAVLTLATLLLQRSGRLEHIVSVEHYHDYGKLMFAFTFFWAYIAFSQYMLIWYANIPEETHWYLVRQQNGWGTVGLITVFATWLAPFAGLMSRFAKRRKSVLAFWAAWIVVAQWINLYWVAMPVFSPERVVLDPMDLLCFVGIGGVWLATVARLASAASLVPVGDPRLEDSLTFENA